MLDKPGDEATCRTQLTALSGHTANFYTGCAVVCVEAAISLEHLDTTTVTFRRLTETEINRYVAREKPFDCAGGFKVEALGITLFESIESQDPTALIGLPLDLGVARAPPGRLSPALTPAGPRHRARACHCGVPAATIAARCPERAYERSLPGARLTAWPPPRSPPPRGLGRAARCRLARRPPGCARSTARLSLGRLAGAARTLARAARAASRADRGLASPPRAAYATSRALTLRLARRSSLCCPIATGASPSPARPLLSASITADSSAGSGALALNSPPCAP